MSSGTLEAPVTERGHTIAETAEILRVHPQTVYRWIWDGLLDFEKRGRKYLIFDGHIHAFRAASSSDVAGGGSQEPSGSGPSGPAGTHPK